MDKMQGLPSKMNHEKYCLLTSSAAYICKCYWLIEADSVDPEQSAPVVKIVWSWSKMLLNISEDDKTDNIQCYLHFKGKHFQNVLASLPIQPVKCLFQDE